MSLYEEFNSLGMQILTFVPFLPVKVSSKKTKGLARLARPRLQCKNTSTASCGLEELERHFFFLLHLLLGWLLGQACAKQRAREVVTP
eukprot:scaffold1368_cov333-Pavlova_lutheri.AAC.5